MPTNLNIETVASQLCAHNDLIQPALNTSMPSIWALESIMERLRAVLFPGYHGLSNIRPASLLYHISAHLDNLAVDLKEQIERGLCFSCINANARCQDCASLAESLSKNFLARLPEIRRRLTLDALAGYEGDPAATSAGETIFCYPSMLVMTHHRIAHELYLLKIPIIPRIIAEMAHSHTGIDIHPGATIGDSFFIDHGTGVVIGETAIVGKHCRLYQGVTLGALSFPKNTDGTLTKGIARHPILEDNVTVYAGATILGRVTIGKGSIIGGNVWLTTDVPENSKIIQTHSSKCTTSMIGTKNLSTKY